MMINDGHTHHYGCICREAYVRSLEKQCADLLRAIDHLNSAVSVTLGEGKEQVIDNGLSKLATPGQSLRSYVMSHTLAESERLHGGQLDEHGCSDADIEANIKCQKHQPHPPYHQFPK